MKVMIFQLKKLFSVKFKRITIAKAFCQLSVNLTSNVSCLLTFLVFVSCQSTPFRPSDKSLTGVITILRQILIPHAGYT